jgi:hypothetical protein
MIIGGLERVMVRGAAQAQPTVNVGWARRCERFAYLDAGTFGGESLVQPRLW